ncbi:MAG TPA: pitrilysin family protein [Xanthobacteraceae bacterium]|nr:pitrilysin family protein [Xanthobacteraceae bacterium]
MNLAARLFLQRAVLGALIFVGAFAALPRSADATTVERIVSPGGIAAWLVSEPSVPLIAMDFAFKGGATQDPPNRAGVANMTAALLDEGAGDIDSDSFHERVESKAIEMGFTATRDYISGSLRTLTENQDEAFDLLRLAITKPHFDPVDVERIREQTLSALRRATMSPNELATERWWATAFAGHPYAQPPRGTLESVPAITVDDLKNFTRKVFARDILKVAIVGNIDAATAGKLLDRVFGDLPATSALSPVAKAIPQGLGQKIAVNLDVPQSVLMIGGAGILRKDPDFMPAFVLNHILGGSAFSSRLYKEVREARGLAYSVYSAVMPLDYAALFMSATATRSDRTSQTLEVIEAEIRKMAETGPTEEELAKAKSFLTGSFGLRFDTSTKIAEQLVLIQLDELGIDYIDKRNGLVEAVTMADVKRVAKRLLDARMLVTVVGKPQPIAAKGG